MAKNTSILLGDHFTHFINEQIKSGKFSSASEVVRTALRQLEEDEIKKAKLIEALEKIDSSGYREDDSLPELLNDAQEQYGIEKIRNSLIRKLLNINNQETLNTINEIITNSTVTEKIKLTVEQKEILEMGYADYLSGNTISQSELLDQERKWLKEE